MHDIQHVLGHSTMATTEKHYAQFSPRSLSDFRRKSFVFNNSDFLA